MPPGSIDIAVKIAVSLGLGIGLINLTMFILSRTTGWRTLAEAFPAQPPSPDARRAFGSIGFHSLGNYNNCVRFRADDHHLHVALMAPFAWMYHAPMSIPWTAVEVTRAKPAWGMSQIRVNNIPIRVPARVLAHELALREQLRTLEQSERQDGQIAARSS